MNVSTTLLTESETGVTDDCEVIPSTVSLMAPVLLILTGNFTSLTPALGTIVVNWLFNANTKGSVGENDRLRLLSQGAKIPPSITSAGDSEEPTLMVITFIEKSLLPPNALFKDVNSLVVRLICRHFSRSDNGLLIIELPSTEIVAYGLFISTSLARANEKSDTPVTGNNNSKKDGAVGIELELIQPEPNLCTSCIPKRPSPGLFRDQSEIPSNPTSILSPSGTEVCTNSTSKTSILHVPLDMNLN